MLLFLFSRRTPMINFNLSVRIDILIYWLLLDTHIPLAFYLYLTYLGQRRAVISRIILLVFFNISRVRGIISFPTLKDLIVALAFDTAVSLRARIWFATVIISKSYQVSVKKRSATLYIVLLFLHHIRLHTHIWIDIWKPSKLTLVHVRVYL